ncbi:Facilitated trehalose transporter Tret1-like protein [Dinothrombium tinctorium]|uniref:Facilitated trehalose transporter Tret1-like protein n=1 Tax=Dinothrombium tinctorium TaxID=1965070 RepID=A0A3S3NTW5_9ACAR|nr:Facilitated trehalose transporter Tret1-like protein [Dinothrombium tinctorium]RWS05907.1 Facilitated trehalose transporter Tret1-like protein [Dinothrombium tinctorium]RWS05986.1 Facilitated trehalose transporter Tret1-like protein [Dinothrombium tinctorium]
MVVEASSNVYLATAAAFLGAISVGIGLGYTSPALITLQKVDHYSNNTSTLINSDRIASKREAFFIGASLTIGAFFGSLFGGPISQILGRRKALILYGIPYAVGCALIYVAENVAIIITGRVIVGLGSGMICSTAPTYVVEISTPKTRGFLGSCFQICITIGIFLMALFGIFSNEQFDYIFTWRYLALIGVLPSLGLSATMLLMPESPSWLILKKFRINEEPEKTLAKLRTAKSDLETELKELKEQTSLVKSNLLSFTELKKPEVWKSFTLSLALMFFQQFSGINIVIFFQTQVLKEAGFSSPAIGTAISCFAQLIFTALGAYIMDKLGRRKLLLLSGCGHSLSLLVLGVYFRFLLNDNTKLTLVPVICLVVYLASYSIGWGPIPWLMIPEITPSTARSFVSSIASSFNSICALIVSLSFDYICEALEISKTFWLYTGFCVVSCIFTCLFLPETKGKTFDDILKSFRKNEPENRSESVQLEPLKQ